MFASANEKQEMYVPCTIPFGIVGLYFFVDNRLEIAVQRHIYMSP